MANKKRNNILIIVLIILAIFAFSKEGRFKGAVSGYNSVTRSISPILGTTVYQDDTATATLTITTATGDKAILIHEEAPFPITGLTTNIYETGILDQIQVQDTTRQYSFIASTSGTHTFTGVYTVNGGADRSITGISSITVASCSPVAETCDNIDNDCDYSIDEALTQACYTGPSGTENVGICHGGTQTCSAGAWGTCTGEQTPLTEICNSGADEDCDGSMLTSNTIADTDCNQVVDWEEVNTAVSDWIAGSISWTVINEIVAAWIGG